MPMKKTVTVLTLVLLFVFTVSTGMIMAQERNSASSPPNAPRADRMSPEEREAYSAMMYEHHQKMAPIRDQMWAKQMEYEALAGNPNARPADVRAVIDDMVKLRAQLRAERDGFRSQTQAKGFGPGHFRGHRGFGPGHFNDDGSCGCGYGGGYGGGYGRDKGPWSGKGHHGYGKGRHGGYWHD